MENFLEILRALSRETSDVNERDTSAINEREGSSGYASATSSLNSSRRSSIQSEIDEASGVENPELSGTGAPRKPDPPAGPNEPSNWTSMFAAIGTAVAVGAAAYVAYKVTTSGATLATTVTECEQQVEEINRY